MIEAKPRKCKHCRTKFVPDRPFIVWCSPECGAELAKAKIARQNALRAKKARKEYRDAKERIKTRQDWIGEAQQVFNRYIRARDKGKPCPSCGRNDHEIENTYWGKWDCGHYLSVGSHPELRFEELNAARQCKSCNGGAGNYAKKNHAVSKAYRAELISRIGLEAVEWLEGPHEPKKYTIEELKEIKATYKAKLKALAK